jgi:hypothetical protein
MSLFGLFKRKGKGEGTTNLKVYILAVSETIRSELNTISKTVNSGFGLFILYPPPTDPNDTQANSKITVELSHTYEPDQNSDTNLIH